MGHLRGLLRKKAGVSESEPISLLHSLPAKCSGHTVHSPLVNAVDYSIHKEKILAHCRLSSMQAAFEFHHWNYRLETKSPRPRCTALCGSLRGGANMTS